VAKQRVVELALHKAFGDVPVRLDHIASTIANATQDGAQRWGLATYQLSPKHHQTQPAQRQDQKC